MTPKEIAEIEERHSEGYPLVEYLIHDDITALLAHVKAQDAEIERLRTKVTPAVVEIAEQRARNHERWGELSIENRPPDYVGWLPTLGEEFGEVCESLVAEAKGNLRAELVDLAAVALMWIDSIDRAALSGASDE